MFSISLKAKGRTEPVAPVKKTSLFTAIDDVPIDAPGPGRSEVNKRLAAMSSGSTSKTQKRRMEDEKKLDQSVYQYDEVWDNMQAAKQLAKESKEAAAKDRQPKYIKNLLLTAETRRLDHLRAEEKMMQREREIEGDEYADKEQFVTQAYKDQMAAVRKAEEEERAREASVKSAGTGMTHFYAQLLQKSEEQHLATVAATQEVEQIKGPTLQNLTISKPPSYVRQSDKQLAELARLEGKDVELNDDNQIVDRRELLSAGLNLSAPNTRIRGGLQRGQKRKLPQAEEAQVHRAVGTAASRKEINERRQREIEVQLAEEAEKVRQLEAEKEEAARRILIKRNTEEEIRGARERFLERKRRRAEESGTGP